MVTVVDVATAVVVTVKVALVFPSGTVTLPPGGERPPPVVAGKGDEGAPAGAGGQRHGAVEESSQSRLVG